MKQLQDLAERGGLRYAANFDTADDDFVGQTFTLPLEAARLTVRDILGRVPQGGFRTIVERWQQLPDRKIEFTLRRVPASD
jgi:hypothetical protein